MRWTPSGLVRVRVFTRARTLTTTNAPTSTRPTPKPDRFAAPHEPRVLVRLHLRIRAKPLDIREARHEPLGAVQVREALFVLTPEVCRHTLRPFRHEPRVRIGREADLPAELSDRVDRNQKIESLDGLIAFQRSRDERGHPDDLALEVECRPATIAPGDRGIRLNHASVVDVDLETGDATDRHRRFQLRLPAEEIVVQDYTRIPDDKDLLAELE